MKFLLLFFGMLMCYNGHTQESYYIVKFSHKAATNHHLTNPAAYLGNKAIERRTLHNIPIDSTDLPVPQNYIQQINAIRNLRVLNQSKWLNAVSISTTQPSVLSEIEALPFVQSVRPVSSRIAVSKKKWEEEMFPPTTSYRSHKQDEAAFDYGPDSFEEINLHNGQFLHNLGLRGQGMRIAMLDGGFGGIRTLPAFDSVRFEGRILSTWDFVAQESDVSNDHPHGMQCFSTIVANIPGQFVGKAPYASFYLFRTEDASMEIPLEEFNWVCGAERADSIGAQIISSSLGYGYDWSNGVADYDYSIFDGNTTLAAQGADLAAAKGMLVFNSAGNSGNDYWKMITTPADADSIVAVGAVNRLGEVGSFSSYGPTADGRIKPDLASVGVAAMIQSLSGGIAASNGTSFAAPNLAGLSACLWQAFPQVNNMRIIRALKESANNYNHPNDRIGYGIPDLKKAFIDLLKEQFASTVSNSACEITVTFTSSDKNGMAYIIESRLPHQNSFQLLENRIIYNNPMFGKRLHGFVYDIVDQSPSDIEFRITQVLDSSAANYTAVILDTIRSNFTQICNSAPSPYFTIYPNPSIGNHQVSIYSPFLHAQYNIVVYNIHGQQLLNRNINIGSGFTSVLLTSQPWPAGLYFVNLLKDGKSVGQQKLIKL